MNTNGKIRNIFATGVLLLAILNVANSQNYTLNYKDTSTYKTTCGSVNPAQWEVKNDSCLLYTPILYPYGGVGDSIMVSFTIRINQSGNLAADDNAYIYMQINSGIYKQKKMYKGVEYSCVFTYTDSIKIARTDNFRFRISLQNNSKSNFWQIKDGDIQVNNVHYGSGSMPVELMVFNGKLISGAVELNWATASETNNDYFTIERSIDGISFEEIGFVQGAGNSNNVLEYKYSDYTSIEEAYYRLKQTDFDGEFSYSGIIKVDAKGDRTTHIKVNGSGNALNLLATTETSGNLQIDIYTIEGNLVYSTGMHVEEGSSTLNINPEITTNSIYIVNVSVNNGMPFTTKIYLN